MFASNKQTMGPHKRSCILARNVLDRPSFQDVVSLRHRAGLLGMGRTGDSLDNELPPRSGGGSPLLEELFVGRERGGPRVR